MTDYRILTESEKHKIVSTLADLYMIEEENATEAERIAEWDRLYSFFTEYSDFELYKTYYRLTKNVSSF
jgi:hypothetical protein